MVNQCLSEAPQADHFVDDVDVVVVVVLALLAVADQTIFISSCN